MRTVRSGRIDSESRTRVCRLCTIVSLLLFHHRTVCHGEPLIYGLISSAPPASAAGALEQLSRAQLAARREVRHALPAGVTACGIRSSELLEVFQGVFNRPRAWVGKIAASDSSRFKSD